MASVTRNLKHNALKTYLSTVLRNKTKIYCQLCNKVMFCKEYEKHLRSSHKKSFKNPNSCCWCLGSYSWPPSAKYLHSNHLKNCYVNYWKTHRESDLPNLQSTPPLSPPPNPVVVENGQDPSPPSLCYDVTISCENLNLFLFERLPEAPDVFYQPQYFPPLPDHYRDLELLYNHPSLSCENNPGIYYLILFETFRAQDIPVQWIQLIVRAPAIPSLLKSVQDYVSRGTENPIFQIPFSCLCDGGNVADAYHRQHKHLLAFTFDSKFIDECWPSVRVRDAPDNPYKCKTHEKIENAFHLATLIHYVSHQRSSCKFNTTQDNEWMQSIPYMDPDTILDQEFANRVQEEQRVPRPVGRPRKNPSLSPTTTTTKNLNHFYIQKSILTCSPTLAATAMEGGMQKLLKRMFGSISMTKYVPLAYKRRDAKTKSLRFTIDIKHLPLPKRQVLPVDRRWIPMRVSREPVKRDDCVMFLPDDFKMFFKRVEHNLTEEQWIQIQANGGNCFWDVMDDMPYYPSKNQQRELSAAKPWYEKYLATNKEKEQLAIENGHLKTVNEEHYQKILQLENECKRFRQKVTKLEKENKNYRQKNIHLEKENEKNRHRITQLETINAKQSQRLDKVSEKYIESLENQVSQLGMINQQYLEEKQRYLARIAQLEVFIRESVGMTPPREG